MNSHPLSADSLRQLEAQGHECAYPCEGGVTGGKLLPGAPLALARDGVGLVHLRCAYVGSVPHADGSTRKGGVRP